MQTGAGRRRARGARARLRVHRPSPSSTSSRARSSSAARTAASPTSRGGRARGAGAWREAFLRMPYLRDMLVRLGVLSDTFETAITWERLPAFHEAVVGATRAALGERVPRDLPLHARLPRRPGALLHRARAGPPRRRARAVARDEARGLRRDPRRRRHDHPPPRRRPRPPPAGTTRQRPDPFAAALRAAKAAVDPKAILNPGVLLDP